MNIVGLYIEPWLFWALLGVAVTVVVGVVTLLVGASRRDVEEVKNELVGLRQQFGQMQAYLDGLPKSTGAVRTSYDAGMAAVDTLKWEEAIGYFREAMKEAKGTELVALFTLIGACHYTLGRLDDALTNYEESVRLAKQFADKEGRAAALGNIGVIYGVRGEPDKALKYFEATLAQGREIGDKKVVAASLGNIGLIYHGMGEFDRALRSHEEALAIAREIGYKQSVANCLGNIGNLYHAKREPDKAFKCHEEALAIAREIRDQQGVAGSLCNIGIIHATRGEPDKALKCIAESLMLFTAIGARLGAEKSTKNLRQLLGQTCRKRFVAGCVEAGMSREEAEKLADGLAKQ